MRMKRPQGYKTKRCKHNNKVRFHFRTLHRLKLEIEWPPCCDPKNLGPDDEIVHRVIDEVERENRVESGGRG